MEDYEYIDFGLALKLIREEKGWTQQQLANKIGHGITKSILSNIESGRTMMQANIIPNVCKAFGITPNQLFGYALDEDRVNNIEMNSDLNVLHNFMDEDIWKMLMLIAHSPYFNLSIMECAAIVVCYPEYKDHMHFNNWSIFKRAVDEGKVIDQEIVQMILSRKDEFLEGCKNIKENIK